MVAAGIALLVAGTLGTEPDAGALQGPFRGEAAVVNGDRAAAREVALENAYREVLLTGAGVIDSPTMLEGANQLQDKILTHAVDYLPTFSVSLDSIDPTSSGIYQVELSSVVVSREKLEHDVAAIRAMLATRGHPRICTIIREDLGAEGPDSASLTADWTAGRIHLGLTTYLLPLGWKFGTAMEIPLQSPHKPKPGEPLQHLGGRDFDTRDADFVVLGSVTIHPSPTPKAISTALSVVEAQVAIRITDSETSDTVAAIESRQMVSSVSGMNQAIESAIQKSTESIADTLSGQVREKWRALQMGSGGLRLTVSVKDYDALTALEDAVRNHIGGVRSVEELRYADGVAELKVSNAGLDAKHLATRLAQLKLPMHLRVVRVTATSVELKITP